MYYLSAQASSLYTGHQQYYYPVHYNNTMLNTYPANQGYLNVSNINNDGRMNPPSADGNGSPPTIPVSHDSDSVVVHHLEEDDTQSCSIDLDLDMDHVSDPDSASNRRKLNEYKEAHMVLGTEVPRLSSFSIPSFTHTSFAFPTPGHQRIPAWAPVQEDYPQGPRAGLPFSCKISWFGVWQEIMQEIWQEIQ